MNCEQAQEAILSSLDGASTDAMPQAVGVHVSTCADCAAFATTQQAIDARLSAAISAPKMSASLRTRLHERMRLEQPPHWIDELPDIVHFASWAAATASCALLLPLDAGAVVGTGIAGALATYVLLTMGRTSLEDAEI